MLPVSIRQEAWRTTELVWTLLRRVKSASAENRPLCYDHTVCSLVTVLNELFIVPLSYNQNVVLLQLHERKQIRILF
jgi:hypothetical protein